MPTIVLDGTGKPKSDLVEGAYELCGLNGFEYERTPEEMSTGLRFLNDMMAEWLADGIDLGFDFPTYGNGLLEAPSGIPDSAVAVVKGMLAQRLCPGLGATLGEDARAALSLSYYNLRARMAATPPSMIPASRMPSLGVRHNRIRTLTTVPVTTGDPGDLADLVGG